MNTRIKDLFIIDASFYKKILLLGSPIILQQLLRMSVDTIDGMILTHIEQSQMAAISLCTSIFFVFYTTCCGLSYGCSVTISQYYGKGDTKSINKVVSAGIKSISVFALVISVALFLQPSFFLRIYSNNIELIDIGEKYIKIAAFMYLPCAISNMLFACCRGVEDVKICFIVNTISYPLNVILDYILILGTPFTPSLGIVGAAIGVVIARLVEFLILCYYIFYREKKIKFIFKDLLNCEKRILVAFLIVAIPMGLHELVWSAGTTASNAITGKMNEDILSGFSISYVLYQIIGTVMNSIMTSSNIMMSQEIGKQSSFKTIKKTAHSILLVGFIGGICSAIVTLLVGRGFISLYQISDSARFYAMQFIMIFALIWPFSGLEMVGMVAVLRAGGDGKTGVITDIVSMWIITIPLAYLGAFKFGWAPVLIIFILKLNIIIEALVAFFRVLSMKWVKNLTIHN